MNKTVVRDDYGGITPAAFGESRNSRLVKRDEQDHASTSMVPVSLGIG